MWRLVICAFLYFTCVSPETIDCSGHHRYSSRGSGFYQPDPALDIGFVDDQGHAIHSLQDFLDGKAAWVSVTMDKYLHIPYGTNVCIPELNHKYNRVIQFRVVDGSPTFNHKGYGRIGICTRSEHDSLDTSLTSPLTLVFH